MDVLSSLLGGESLLDVFSNTITGWLGNLVTSAFEKFDQLMLDLLGTAFHVDFEIPAYKLELMGKGGGR